jgi:hypothetical protein
MRSIVLAAACLLLFSGCRHGDVSGPPAIEFVTIPDATDGGSDKLAPVAGRVRGAGPGQKIVLFTKAGVWWVQPFTSRPMTDIEADFTWASRIHLGTDYAALLVQADYRPPATIETLPQPGGGVLAVAAVAGAGAFAPKPRKTLTFSGYEWDVRQVPSERAGVNDYDARNAWVDAEGHLHLMLAQRDGKWTSAEVKLTRSLGYGTYLFVVRDTSHLDPAAALGMVTWDDLGADQNHRELDIEISKWGDPGNKDVQYVVQPHYVAANVFRFAARPGRLTHSFRWEPGRASFQTVSGVSESAVPVAQRDFTSGVPTPGGETVRLNLLYFRGSKTPPLKEVEVVIEKFGYLP